MSNSKHRVTALAFKCDKCLDGRYVQKVFKFDSFFMISTRPFGYRSLSMPA